MKKEKVWAGVLEEMAQKIPEPSFTTWFKTTKATDLNEYCLTVEVENEFQKNWLHQRYWTQINKIKDTILPKEIEVVLTVKNKKEQGGIDDDVPSKVQSYDLIRMVFELKNRVDHLENEVKQLKA